jgi:hypothetical protein
MEAPDCKTGFARVANAGRLGYLPIAAAVRGYPRGEGAVAVRRWLDPGWYRFLWRRIGPDGRLLVGVLAAAAVAFGGFFSVRAFASSDSSTSAGYVRMTTTITITKVVRVNGHGRTIVRRMPIVRRIVANPVTVEETTTVPGHPGTTVATATVVHTQRLTDTRRMTVTTERTATVVQRSTDERTVVETQTVTVVRTQTSPPETVLIHEPASTVTVRTTVPFMTITIPTYTIP